MGPVANKPLEETISFELLKRSSSIPEAIKNRLLLYGKAITPYIGDRMMHDEIKKLKGAINPDGQGPIPNWAFNTGEGVFYLAKYSAFGLILYDITQHLP